jgi:cyclopropane-fatty-acyl-phospholipid synthase
MAASAGDFELVFRNNRAKARAALYRHIGLLESYFDGDIELRGDLRVPLREAMAHGSVRPNWLVALRNRAHEWRHSNRSWEQARANARFHYGLGTGFYRLWLDRELMMYTCAYWKDGTRDLEEAQRNKVEHVCRKVMLGPGDDVIDVGCGFGGFMFHAHERHGANVVGLNTTPEQNAMVREEIARRGLGGALSVVETDFRDTFREFDKVVSIGVLEHAGRDQLAEVVRAHARFLKPGGLGLLHFIGHVGRQPTEYFIREFVFPGGWIPSLADVIVAMEDAGLEVLDVENLRRHYALTLDAWAERFDAQWGAIQALDPRRFDERFRRIWRTYLLGCAEMFRLPNGRTHLFQIVFARGNVSWAGFPRGREYMYAPLERTRGRDPAAPRSAGGAAQ